MWQRAEGVAALGMNAWVGMIMGEMRFGGLDETDMVGLTGAIAKGTKDRGSERELISPLRYRISVRRVAVQSSASASELAISRYATPGHNISSICFLSVCL